jgi:hypothetical protein
MMPDEIHTRRDVVMLPTIWVAIALSVLIHILVLGKWLPQVRLPSLDELALGEASRSLVVNLAPPSAPRPPSPPSPSLSPSPKAAPAPTLPSPRPKAAVRPRPAPPVLALEKPAPEAAPAQPVTPPAPAGDLASYIEAQRRARVASAPPSAPSPATAPASNAPPVDDEAARADRAVVANLGLNRAPTYGPDPTRSGGGIFQIHRLGYNDAEFYFYGWNKDIRRNTTQLIEVSKGDSGDIRLAVVRRMIGIIREHEKEDFLWESPRLGRNIMLSARQRDNAGLEEFMLREFFSGPR